MKSARIQIARAYALAALCLAPGLTDASSSFPTKANYTLNTQTPSTTDLTQNETKALDTLVFITSAQMRLFQQKSQLGTPKEIAEAVSTTMRPSPVVEQTEKGYRFEKDGYRFDIRVWSRSEGTQPTSEIAAVPISYGVNNRKSFYLPYVSVMTFAVYCADKQGAESTDQDPVLLDRGAILDRLIAEMKKAQMAALETAALMELQNIVKAEEEYLGTIGKKRSYASLKQLAASGLIAPELGEGQKGGYQFLVSVKPGSKSFEAEATPVEYGRTGIFSFYVNQSGTIRGGDKKGKRADKTDEPVFK
jgi:hypothetical protein